MKRIVTFAIILMALTACTSFRIQITDSETTEISQPNMPNPASAYCEQNGYILEIHTAEEGSQSGVCVFPDGSSCDEWAYFRGECGPNGVTNTGAGIVVSDGSADTAGNAAAGYIPPETAEEIADWRGVIKSTAPGAQFDDYFELWINGQVIYFGIDSLDPAVQAQIVSLRESGTIVHLYGTLLSNVPDYNGSQVQVDRIVIEE